jgi:hypothetical protein
MPNYTLVNISGYLVYVIPRRSFATGDEYDAFFKLAADWHQASRNS